MKNMPNKNTLAIFDGYKIRRHYDEKTETWFFSVIDIVAALIEQADFKKAKSYWTTLKNRLKNEGSELVTKCDQLKMIAEDGKMRETDVANAETILRLVQSVLSKKAEPTKLWLAKVGYERMQELADPERSVNRARENWEKHGRSKEWIQRRMMGQETRNKLTDYWSGHNVKEGEEFAILTNIIHQEWSDVSVKDHKKLKGLKTQNLRDHMSEAELIFTALAEMSKENPENFLVVIEIDSEVVGAIGAHHIVHGHKAELGYWLAEQHWGKGIIPEAVKKVMPQLFSQFKLRRLFAYAYANNKASMRVMEKVGMKFEGILLKHAMKNGKYIDCHMYAKVK